MAFQTKRPPIKIKLSVKKFNLLVGILKYNEQKNTNDDNNISKKLREKLLQYSIPFKDENNKELIEVGLFISEVASIINELLIYNIDDAIDVNYFDVLVEQRKKFTEKKNVQNN